jgi:hypothetical protein
MAPSAAAETAIRLQGSESLLQYAVYLMSVLSEHLRIQAVQAWNQVKR